MSFEPAVDARDDAWPRNPLIAAVVWQLPKAGPFPAEQRAAWLKMMATAFDVAYGPVGSAPGLDLYAAAGEGAAGATPPAQPTRPRPAAELPVKRAHAGHDFYIALDGTACDAGGEPVSIDAIPPDEMIFDYRPVTGEFRDLESIVWADGARGTAGLAPGVSFCGPG